ncbi:MAG: hypothetical protein ACSLFQ_10775 [Thermoanaerobaculia bacterium]
MNTTTRNALLIAFIVLASVAAIVAAGILVFSLSFSEKGLIAISADPMTLQRVDLRDATNRTLWSVEADAPTAVNVLRYGETPEGFRERVARRRGIRPGEPLVLLMSSGARWVRIEGVGRRKDGFRGGEPTGGDFATTPASVVFDEDAPAER